MFTDELKSNSAKKRADDAKARRIRAKREKEAKEERKRKELERRATATGHASSHALVADASFFESANSLSSSSPLSSKGTSTEPPDMMPDQSIGNLPGGRSEGKFEGGQIVANFTSKAAVVRSEHSLTAAQKANELRKVRSEAKAQKMSAMTIQSFIRSKITTQKAKEDQRVVFDRRISDIIALAAIVKRSSERKHVQSEPSKTGLVLESGAYVPPPATVTIMTSQFLFFACPSTLRKKSPGGLFTFGNFPLVLQRRDLPRWDSLLRHVLLPGVLGEDLELDPLLPWVESVGGSRRLGKVLELCVTSVSRECKESKRNQFSVIDADNRNVSSAGYRSAVDCFLRSVLRLGATHECRRPYSGGSRSVVYHTCISLLMLSSPPTYSPLHHFNPIAHKNSDSLSNEFRHRDLIFSLRSLLLFGPSGKSVPISVDADRLRENCVTDDEKERANLLVRLVVDIIAAIESSGDGGGGGSVMTLLCSRFVSEVLSVPLFTWKVGPSAYRHLLLSPTDRGSNDPGSSPVLVRCIHHFIYMNTDDISSGRIASLMNMADISLSLCPAPPVLSLLANLVQLGRVCVPLNALDVNKFHYEAAAEFYNFLALLINAIPLGTFSSRMSAVEWVSIGSSSTPITLSNVIVDQTSALLSDSFIRSLFKCAINDEIFDTQNIINTKTDKDKKHEEDLNEVAASSVASVAAKEAMADRGRNLWLSSKWAKKLSSSMSNLISGSRGKSSGMPRASNSGAGQLMNTSFISRQLAHGKGPTNRTVTDASLPEYKPLAEEGEASKPQHQFNILFFFSICRVYGTIISRWGGSGTEDVVMRVLNDATDSTKISFESASATLEPCVTSILSVLSFSTSIIPSSWALIQSNPRVVSDLYAVIDVRKRTSPIRTLNTIPCYTSLFCSHLGASEGNIGAIVLFLFLSCLSHVLIVTDDAEIHEMERPLPRHQWRRCILLLKKLLYRACCLDDVHEKTKIGFVASNHFGLALVSVSSKVMNDLYDRSSRRLLCVPKLWIEDDLLEKDLRQCKTHLDFASLLSSPVCRVCPFLISFKTRLKLFERIVTTNRIDIQGSNELRNLKPGITVKVNRGRVLEDGLIHLNNLGRQMRQRIVVCYLSQAGAKETGVDVGGLFKEFWTDLSNMAFDPNYALFRVTEGSGGTMYPNPSSKLAHGSDHTVLFEFLGRILGKALYEGITIQPQFAHLFLSFLRGDHQFLHLLPDLSTIDPQLYNNLMFLKSYDGDVSELCLSFTVANDDFGVSEVPLLPNGANLEVTNDNKRRYIYLMAKHHVCDRIKEQSDAFTRGLWEVIDKAWLRIFNEPELQVLISGASDGKIDVADMKSNTRYTGGYTILDRNITRFWNVVSSFDPKHQADLLRFVTSCERPPPLGFVSMNPPFTIQRVGIMKDGDKLPTASTCFNTLKLPTYSSEKVLKDRLLYAIQACAGFELT